jgi:hypothetical protein
LRLPVKQSDSEEKRKIECLNPPEKILGKDDTAWKTFSSVLGCFISGGNEHKNNWESKILLKLFPCKAAFSSR